MLENPGLWLCHISSHTRLAKYLITGNSAGAFELAVCAIIGLPGSLNMCLVIVKYNIRRNSKSHVRSNEASSSIVELIAVPKR